MESAVDDPPSDFGDILHAYALVESKSEPGRYHALHLEGVIAERATRLAPSHRNSGVAHSAERIGAAIHKRTVEKGWNKP